MSRARPTFQSARQWAACLGLVSGTLGHFNATAGAAALVRVHVPGAVDPTDAGSVTAELHGRGAAAASAAERRAALLALLGAWPGAPQHLESLTDEELWKAAQNTTEAIHAQAVVVSTATDRVYAGSEALEDKRAREGELSARYTQAHAEAEKSSRLYQAFLVDLAAAKLRRDGLWKETEELQARLRNLTAQSQAAAFTYEEKLSLMPWLQDAANRANATDVDLGLRRRLAADAARAAKAQVEYYSLELEKSIKELNSRNQALHSIQAELADAKNAAPGRARRPALLAAAAAAALALAVPAGLW